LHRIINMKLNRPYILYISICLWLLFLPSCTNHLWGKDFVVVIDAGHGGHDPGAIGKISKEKNINLNVALKVGNLIKRNCDDVKVIYTRSKDVFIPLDRRAEIANNAKADLFISIHTNALAKNRTAKGASTWTLGLAKSDANLEVAKRENSVILYESDYKTRYAGFNPNSAESYIIFEFMQDKYMEQSVHLASLMQKQFRQTCKRADRGVHQAGFLVLKASAMPSILIELGFISTPEEERYLNSKEGADTMAKGIYRAFLNYKREHELRLTGVSKTIVPTEQEEDNALAIAPKDTESVNTAPQQEKLLAEARTRPAATAKTAPKRPIVVESATNDSKITFKIQILTSSKPLAKNDKRLKGLKEVDYYKEGGLYKYTYGASADYNKVLRTKRTITAQFKDAFIIAFRNGEKMNINEAIAEFKKRRNK
jgi:N-acetylmuramoyl-L-alanine amidase